MRRLRARSVLLAGILAVGLGCGSDEVPSVADSTPRAGGTAPYLVKIHADWCGVCNRLTPLWNRLGEEYGDSVQMVFFDVSVGAHRAGRRVLRGPDAQGLSAAGKQVRVHSVW